jgi:hypothetical protein
VIERRSISRPTERNFPHDAENSSDKNFEHNVQNSPRTESAPATAQTTIGANAILWRKFGAEIAHHREQTVAGCHEAGHACVGRILGPPSADAYIAGGAGPAHVHTRGNRTTASVVVMMAGAEAEVLFAWGGGR